MYIYIYLLKYYVCEYDFYILIQAFGHISPSQISMVIDIQLEMAYCNENVAVWEPLIERIQCENSESHRPFAFSIQVSLPLRKPIYTIPSFKEHVVGH